MIVFHVTTEKKLERYKASGCILAPVRFWSTRYAAERWARKTGRGIILSFARPEQTYPLPIKGGALWSPKNVQVATFL